MKKIAILLLLFTTYKWSGAQNVGIGTATPDSSAMLEIKSNDKGLLLPRVNDTAAIRNPVKGLLIYNNNDNLPWYYDGKRWQKTITDITTYSTEALDSLWYKVQDSIAYSYYPYVHINTNLSLIEPQTTLQAMGSLLIQGKLNFSSSTPTPGQTYTMNNTSTVQTIPGADSVFRIYDPGGTGNYNNNMQGNVAVALAFKEVGIKVNSVAADFGLGTGDTLWISYDVFPACRTNYAYRFAYPAISPADFVVGENGDASVYFIFRSNGDGNNGKGFNFLVTRLFNSEKYKKVQTTGPSLYFNSTNGAFAAGYNADVLSTNGTALGSFTKASAPNTTAMGYFSKASASYATAMGYATTASGTYSTAIGYFTTASGQNSTAIGNNTTASGQSSTATGYTTTASGNRSTAMGNFVNTNNYDGAFVIGDNSTTTLLYAANANNFRARFAGGYRLFTSADYTTGCTLYAGDNAWTTGSDVRTKENFAEVNGEDFLKKISGFHLSSWNYKTQDPKTFRHYGPMAQDFYAAFGKDKYGIIGNDTTINSADFAGVSFVAIQALEKRTQKVEQLENENASQAARLEELEKLLKRQQQLIELMQKEIEQLKVKFLL